MRPSAPHSELSTCIACDYELTGNIDSYDRLGFALSRGEVLGNMLL